MDKFEIKKLQTLRKRADYLKNRIDKSPFDLSYDKQEYSALVWALSIIANHLDIDGELE